ncbi:hypothetical protein BJ170DRAFT_688201 [Xylariales sp. AK1849]|nr:hypothetical protein BJ170DRAFT_688201 [Xylariales sp. AK1849]
MMTDKSIARASAPKIGVPATAVVLGSFLSGAMVSLSAFTVPVFLDTNNEPDHMLGQWASLYHYGHIYLPALCVTTCGLYGCAALGRKRADRRASQRYALAAISTMAMVPFTWMVMAPTNDVLFALGASGSGVELGLVHDLVVKWAWMHTTRSMSPLFGAFLGFSTLLRELRA